MNFKNHIRTYPAFIKQLLRVNTRTRFVNLHRAANYIYRSFNILLR